MRDRIQEIKEREERTMARRRSTPRTPPTPTGPPKKRHGKRPPPVCVIKQPLHPITESDDDAAEGPDMADTPAADRTVDRAPDEEREQWDADWGSGPDASPITSPDDSDSPEYDALTSVPVPSTASSSGLAGASTDPAPSADLGVGPPGAYVRPVVSASCASTRRYDLSPAELQALRSEQFDAVANDVGWADRGPRGDSMPAFWRGQGFREGHYGGKKRYAKRGGQYREYFSRLAAEGRLVPGRNGASRGKLGEAFPAMEAMASKRRQGQ